jgi:hypothetical protein
MLYIIQDNDIKKLARKNLAIKLLPCMFISINSYRKTTIWSSKL